MKVEHHLPVKGTFHLKIQQFLLGSKSLWIFGCSAMSPGSSVKTFPSAAPRRSYISDNEVGELSDYDAFLPEVSVLWLREQEHQTGKGYNPRWKQGIFRDIEVRKDVPELVWWIYFFGNVFLPTDPLDLVGLPLFWKGHSVCLLLSCRCCLPPHHGGCSGWRAAVCCGPPAVAVAFYCYYCFYYDDDCCY